MNSRFASRIRLFAAVPLLAAAGGLGVITATPASAATGPRPALPVHSSASAGNAAAAAGTFPLINFNSGKCLGISGGRSDAPAIQWDCNGHADQQWHFGASVSVNGLTFYQLINGDGQCLGTLSGSISDGAHVVGWSCLGGHADQYWVEDNGRNCAGYHPFFNLNAYLNGTFSAFGVSGNSTATGAPSLLWHFQSTCNNQEWIG